MVQNKMNGTPVSQKSYSLRSVKKIALLMAFVSYCTAAIYYWPYGGVNNRLAFYACPLCPDIFTLWGTPASRFVRFTLVMGTINTVVLFAVGLLLVGGAKLYRRVKSS